MAPTCRVENFLAVWGARTWASLKVPGQEWDIEEQANIFTTEVAPALEALQGFPHHIVCHKTVEELSDGTAAAHKQKDDMDEENGTVSTKSAKGKGMGKLAKDKGKGKKRGGGKFFGGAGNQFGKGRSSAQQWLWPSH